MPPTALMLGLSARAAACVVVVVEATVASPTRRLPLNWPSDKHLDVKLDERGTVVWYIRRALLNALLCLLGNDRWQYNWSEPFTKMQNCRLASSFRTCRDVSSGLRFEIFVRASTACRSRCSHLAYCVVTLSSLQPNVCIANDFYYCGKC